jgi:hypothetical protein
MRLVRGAWPLLDLVEDFADFAGEGAGGEGLVQE